MMKLEGITKLSFTRAHQQLLVLSDFRRPFQQTSAQSKKIKGNLVLLSALTDAARNVLQPNAVTNKPVNLANNLECPSTQPKGIVLAVLTPA
ncbi:hypothetical protein HPP92_015055 [Vanilla planifolia]|uniref:Uncharacterized protein n=1 Tax=Vanilla planifolia TaxID=51239 RepID=A0A835UTB4_VANPL|nr:hypothetical protein HPP92_015055 [Vanilla planifolia]